MQVWVDNKFYNVDVRSTIFQFCAKIGINLPCFCYHEKLTIAGNCRMCLVEVSTAVNLVVSCAMPVLDKMHIFTLSKRVRKARENILEFLLVNHPLDCPICDQGGECDLQDLSMVIGSDRSRFYDSYKRSVDNLQCVGPLVKTIMTRCIHCTRCVRFLNEISGINELGVIGRGNYMEIGTYVSKFISDELLGNIIDLCPVGALTSMPYAFNARAWELKKFKSVDVLDALGSSIRIDVANNIVVRIVPSLDEILNEEWISNKARFSYDSLQMQRSYYPQVNLYGKFINLSWTTALLILLRQFQNSLGSIVEVVCGSYLSIEAAMALKYYFAGYGCSTICYENDNFSLFDFRFSFLLNSTITYLERINNFLFIGTNLRLEAPIINARIRKAYLSSNDFKAYSLGLAINYLTYPVLNLGNSISSVISLIEGRFSALKNLLLNDFYNLAFFNIIKYDIEIFLGMSIFKRADGNAVWLGILQLCTRLSQKLNSLHVINMNLGRISYAELGFCGTFKYVREAHKNLNFVYLCGCDPYWFKINKEIGNDFIVFQGSFINNVNFINLILPVPVYTESVNSYLNLEGRYRRTSLAVKPFFGLLSDLQIFQTLQILKKRHFNYQGSIIKNFNVFCSFFNKLINYNCFFFYNLQNTSCKLKGEISKSFNNMNPINLRVMPVLGSIMCQNIPISKCIYNYYMSDAYSLNSRTMMLCARKTRYLLFN